MKEETGRVLVDLQRKHLETLSVSISGLQTLNRVFLPRTDKTEQQETIQQTGLLSLCSLMGCIDECMHCCITYKLHPIHYDTICWSSLKAALGVWRRVLPCVLVDVLVDSGQNQEMAQTHLRYFQGINAYQVQSRWHRPHQRCNDQSSHPRSQVMA